MLGKSKYDHFISFKEGGCVSLRYKFATFKCLKINNVSIDSIWCPCDSTTDPNVVRARGWKMKCHNSFHDTSSINKIGHIPVEIQKLMGYQTINGKQYFVRHISFSVDYSGHACANSLGTIYTDKGNLYIEYNHDNGKNYLGINHPYVLQWLKLFNKNLELKFPSDPYWQFEKFLSQPQDLNGTFLQRVDNEWFPAYESTSWKKYYEHAFKQYDNFERLKVYHQEDNCVYLLNRVNTDELEGQSNLIFMPNYYTHDCSHFIRLNQYNFKDNTSFVRYNVVKVKKDKIHVISDGHSSEFTKKDGTFYKIYSQRNL